MTLVNNRKIWRQKKAASRVSVKSQTLSDSLQILTLQLLIDLHKIHLMNILIEFKGKLQKAMENCQRKLA